MHGSYASSLGARPSLRPRAPGHFPSHPPRSRGCKLREAGSGHVNQPGPPASRLHLPSPPPQKIKAEKERKKKVTNLGTSLRGLRLRPREAARPRPDAPEGGGIKQAARQPPVAGSSQRVRRALAPRTGRRRSGPALRQARGPSPSRPGQSCANSPTTGKYSPAAAGSGAAEILGSLRQISHRKGGRRRRGRELQWRRRAALGLGCAERLWLCQGLCCNKGLPLPHSRACCTALSRPRLRGDSGSAHQFAAASASLPLPLDRPPTPPLAARGTRGRLFVATSFCVGFRGGWRNPHRGGRRGDSLTTPLAPLPRVGLGPPPPPPVCTAGWDWAPPDSPRAGCCFPTLSRCQTPAP